MRGLVAQQKFFPDCPADGALADTDLVIKLLDEMFSDSHELLAAKKRLWHTTRDLVDQHWLAIEGLARTLWSKPWTPRSLEKERDWSKEPLEKWMSGDEVVRVLNQFDIPAFIVDDSMGQYAPPPQAMGSGY